MLYIDFHSLRLIIIIGHFLFILYNKITMLNQLVSQSMRQKLTNRSSISPQQTRKYNDIPLQQSVYIQKSNPQIQEQQERIYQSLLRNSYDSRVSNNLSEIIREKLRSKKVQIPRYQSSLGYQRAINDNSFENLRQKIRNERYQNRVYRQKIREDLRRYKTEHINNQQESQDQNRHFKQAMTEIQQLNYSMARRDRRNAVKPFHFSHQYTPIKRHQDFRNISRRQDFQRYIDHLEKMNLRKMGIDNNQKFFDLPINLNRSNVQTLPKRPVRQIKPIRIQQTPPKVVPTEKNDSFIKILKKVKARGQSLLVKIAKFPSYKLVNA